MALSNITRSPPIELVERKARWRGNALGGERGFEPRACQRWFWGARKALELTAGAVSKTQTAVGDVIFVGRV